jgi:hypothetical protein
MTDMPLLLRVSIFSCYASVAAIFVGIAIAAPAIAQVREFIVVAPGASSSPDHPGSATLVEGSFATDETLRFPADQPHTLGTIAIGCGAPSAVADGTGGYYLAYVVERHDSTGAADRDVVMRHIDHSGADLLGDESAPWIEIARSRLNEESPRLLRLPDGSVLITYEVHYDATPHGDVDIAAVWYNSDGSRLRNPVWVVKSGHRETVSALVTNGRDGAYVVIESGVYKDSLLTGSDIVVQQLDSAGTVGWKDSREPMTVAASQHLERRAVAVADGFGGLYAAYEIEYTKDGRNGDIDILAQRIDEFGHRRWVNEEAVPFVSSSTAAAEQLPSIVVSGRGIIVAYEFTTVADKRTRTKSFSSIGLQRMDSTGRRIWFEGKKSKLVSVNGTTASEPLLVADTATGGAYLVFRTSDSTQNSSNIVAQRIADNSDLLWNDGDGVVPLFNSTDNELSATAIADQNGGLIAIALREPPFMSPSQYSAVVANRLNGEGMPVWENPPPPLVVITSLGMKLQPLLIPCP